MKNYAAVSATSAIKTRRCDTAFRRIAPLCCAALLLASTPAFARSVSRSPSDAGTAAPTSSATPDAAGRALDAFARAWSAIASYSATVTLFEEKGDRTQEAVLKYTFRKPSIATAYEAAGANAGVTLDWDGGDSVTAHRSGFLHLLKKTLPLHDPVATTIRGSSIDELSFGAILSHAEHVAGTMSVAPGDVINGVPTEAFTLVPTNAAADAGLTREVLDLSTTTHLPVRVVGYENTTEVRKIDFSVVAVKAPAQAGQADLGVQPDSRR
jgi:hypothetical protein